MTDQLKTQISGMMDGELDSVAVEQLLRNRNLRQTWQRYHIISEVIQNRTPVHTDPQFSLRISEIIRNEPAILAPLPRRMPTYLKPAAGMAVAASVAALAILGVQQYRGGSLPQEAPAQASLSSPQPLQTPAAVTAAAPVVAGVAGESVAVRQVVTNARYRQVVNNPQISRYILNHNEYQSNAGVHGVTPHVRLVATDGR